MKKPSNRFITRSQILSLAPLLICATASATPVLLNENNATNVWTFPTGTNLLNGNSVTTPAAPASADHGNNDITSASWATLTDNSLGVAANKLTSVAPLNNTSVVFPLNTSVNTAGYTITEFDSYCAWPDGGRDNQNFSILYSTVANPTNFLPLATVANPSANGSNATHTKVTDSSGVLATGVAMLRFDFANQENGYVGYREFIALGTAVPLASPLTWTGSSGSAGNATWTGTDTNNWKLTSSGATTPYSALAPLSFDSTATNRNITLPSALTAASLAFSNGTATPYVFNGTAALTVSNDLTGSNAGAVTFNNPVTLTTGATMAGAGSLTFAAPLTSNGVTLTGTGAVNLSAANSLTGAITVANGALKVGNNSSLGTASLAINGGSVSFITAAPVATDLSGTGGSIILGNTSPVVNSTLTLAGTNALSYAGTLVEAPGAKGSLNKIGTGSVLLGGVNTYTGTTTIAGGMLEFGQRTSLYNANTASWTAANLLVSSGSILGFRVGGTGEFLDSDFSAIKTGGMQAGSSLGLDTTSGNFTLATALSGTVGLTANGSGVLTLTGANTQTGMTLVTRGGLALANTTGHAITGPLTIGDGSFDATVNLLANDQFAPTSVITWSNGNAAANGKFQLKGTTQTVEGIESTPNNRLTIIQNDEAATIGYVAPLAAAPGTLILNCTTDHSFFGLIRNGDAGTGKLGITKEGNGTQELINAPIQATGFTGPTIINHGKLKLTYSGGVYISPITVNSPGIFGLDGTFSIGQVISGNGKVLKEGGGMVTNTGTQCVNSGGTDVTGGIYQMSSDGSTGAGTAAGDHCVAGLMDPTNVVTVSNGATLALNGTAPLGNSTLTPQFSPSVVINETCVLQGSDNSISFVPNLTLNGGTVNVGDGVITGGFNTNMALVGTVTVGGTSVVPSMINTTGFNTYANASLGTPTLPQTTFQVADVTGDSSDDLTVNSILQDTHAIPSSLTKTGPGTMHVTLASTYTGATNVNAGTLVLDNPSLAAAGDVSIGATATLSLQFTGQDTVHSLTIGGTAMAPGSYASSTSTVSGVIKTPRIVGNGVLVVTNSVTPATGYDAFAAQITDSTQRDRTADPDHDGYSNLQEYLFGTSPIAVNGSLIRTQATANGFIIRWNQLSTPTTSTYVLKESTDLVTWTASTLTVSDDPVQNTTGYTQKQATVVSGAGKKFYRVEATE